MHQLAERPVADHRRSDLDWWRSAVIYQVYIRSFADGDGDGTGDIAGIRSRLPYLAELGVDALWINPWYPSPLADAGYDVADPCGIAPVFGTLDEAEQLIAEAHDHGLRIILDVVPNHTSEEHEWFRLAKSAAPGSPERARYVFRPGSGPGGELPPNNWRSVFGGSAWSRVVEPDGTPGEWYLHLFAPEQPDLDWSNPEVAEMFEDVLRFWFDRGVDGFRIDVAHGLAKRSGLPDLSDPSGAELLGSPDAADHPHWDREDVHEVWRRWRRLADSYDPPRVFVAEAWTATSERLARYVRPDELHTAFNFHFLRAPWNARELRSVIDASSAEIAKVGAPSTWVLSNHDVLRVVSRYARPQSDVHQHSLADVDPSAPVDLAVGTRRARAAALLMLALPGSAYVYQGEELGLWEVEDLPEELLDDPVWERSGHTKRGRDGCRVPIPWSATGPSLGFGPDGAAQPPWLPQPAAWSELAADVQDGDPGSVLSLYRRALAVRRELAELGDGTLEWESEAGSTQLRFTRSGSFTCLVNVSGDPVPVPAGHDVLLASSDLDDPGAVPADTTVWLRAAD